jgi:hypothetical protein
MDDIVPFLMDKDVATVLLNLGSGAEIGVLGEDDIQSILA